MSSDILATAKQAERDLNSYQAKVGHGGSDTTTESGIDSTVEQRFPGAKVTYGSAASGAGDNREIPECEGGGVLPNGQTTKARDFEGEGGPEEKARQRAQDRGGEDGVESLVRN